MWNALRNFCRHQNDVQNCLLQTKIDFLDGGQRSGNPDLVARDDQGKPYTVRYEAVNAMLPNQFLKEHRIANRDYCSERGLLRSVLPRSYIKGAFFDDGRSLGKSIEVLEAY